MNWFQTREPREQYLIIVMAILVLFFVGWQFVINPVQQARLTALQSQATALRDQGVVEQGIALLQSPDAGAKIAFSRDGALNTARQNALNVSRVQPSNEGGLTLWFENASAMNVLAFLKQITSEYSVTVNRAQITRRDNQTVTAQITLEPV